MYPAKPATHLALKIYLWAAPFIVGLPTQAFCLFIWSAAQDDPGDTHGYIFFGALIFLPLFAVGQFIFAFFNVLVLGIGLLHRRFSGGWRVFAWLSFGVSAVLLLLSGGIIGYYAYMLIGAQIAATG